MPKYRGLYRKSSKKRGYRWYWYIDYKGKRIYSKGGFDAAEDAGRDRTLKKKELETGTYIQPHKITVKDFIVKYLKEYAAPSLRRSTFISIESIARKHIIPSIGDILLQDLRAFHIERLKNSLMDKLSEIMVYNSLVTLRKILNKGIKWDFINYNPMSKIDFPKKPKVEHPVLSPEQLFKIVDDLEGYPKYVVALAGFSALRRAEICGLQWQDINFKDNTIHIQRQWHHGAVYDVKTEGSEAVIPIWHRLTKMLKEWKLRCGSHTWVFPSDKIEDAPLSPEGWSTKMWPDIRERYNLDPRLRFHDLRHTFATIMIAQGVSVPDVQKLMRHASYQTTMDVYRHLLPNQLEKAIQALDALYVEKSVENGG